MGSVYTYKMRYIYFFLLLAIAVSCCISVRAAEPIHTPERTLFQATDVPYGATSSPLVFIPNRGQLINTEGQPQNDIAYTAEHGGAALFFRTNGVSYVFTRKQQTGTGTLSSQSEDLAVLASSRVDMVLIGANPSVAIVGEDQIREYFNFYYGHCPSGIVDVPGYSRLVYRNVYNNIDLVFYSNSRGLKYDFIVHPGGNPEAIRMAYRGAQPPVVTADGQLHIAGELGVIQEETPVSYQQSGALRTDIHSRFRLTGEDIGFEIDEYNPASALVIDPGILWATYLGGSAADGALATGVDAQGNITISGYTESVNFPVTIGAIQTTLAGGTVDLFIAKLNSSGERLWTTYYGGNASDYSGSARTGLAITPAGAIVITGHSAGGSFPVTLMPYNGGLTDAFLLKLSSAGQRQWATFCGGNDADYGRDVAVDGNGNVYMLGVTWSTRGTFSANSVFQNNKSDLGDAFVMKFASDGTPLTGAFYGGNGSDIGNAIALDPNNSVIISGETNSNSLPLVSGSLQSNNAGSTDVFIAKYNNTSAMQLLWSSFLGGALQDIALGIATDVSGNIFVAGMTASTNFPVSSQAMQGSLSSNYDAFISKITSTGQQILWSTYYGGNGNDEARVVQVDDVDNVVVAGITGSSNLALSSPTYQENLAGASDAFLLRLNSTGQKTLATYFGGSSTETANALSLSSGTMIMAGVTQSTNLPVSIAAHQKNNGGSDDAFIAKFGECNATVDITPAGTTTLCQGSSLLLDAGLGYSAYLWSNGATTRQISVTEPGTYTVTVVGIGGCQATDSIQVTVNPIVQAERNLTLCEGDIGVLSVAASSSAGNLRYAWTPSIGLSCVDCPTPTVVVNTTTAYRVTVTDGNGCKSSTTITVSVNPMPKAEAGSDMMACPGTTVPLFASGGEKYQWSPAEGLTCTTCQGPLAVFPVEGSSITYYVRVTGKNGCSAVDSVTLYAKSVPVAKAGRDTTVCAGTQLRLSGSGGVLYRWEPAADLDCPTCPDPTTTAINGDREYTLTVTDALGCTAQDKIKISVRPSQPLVAASSKIDFGQLGECESSALRSVVVFNSTADNITIDNVIISNARLFARVDRTGRPVPSVPFMIKAGAHDTLYFLFTPNAAVPVHEHVTLRGTPCNVDFTLELIGRKTSIAVNTGNVSIMSFGSMLACETARRDTTIDIYNMGSGSISMRASIGGSFTILSDISLTKPVVIRSGESYPLRLRFSAATPGVFAEELYLPYEGGSCSGEMRIPVMAVRSQPVLSLSASDIVFPALLGCDAMADTLIEFVNTGDVPLTITNASDNSIFTLGVGLPMTLAPGESGALPVRFQPASAGAFSSVLKFTGEPCNIAYELAVSGVKQSVGFEVLPTVSLPALVACTGATADTVLSITNTSGNSVQGTVKRVSVTGPFATSLRPGDIISSGGIRNFDVQLTAAGAGSYAGTMEIVFEPCDIVKTIILQASVLEASFVAQAPSVDFGKVPVSGTRTRTVFFRNTGATPVLVQSLVGVQAPYVLVSTVPALPAQLDPGSELAVEIEYTGEAVGVDYAVVRAVVAKPCALDASVELAGETVRDQFPMLSAAAVDFGKVQVNKSASKELVVKNVGSASAEVNSLALVFSGSSFSLSIDIGDLPAVIAPGDSLAFAVDFKPDAVAVFTGNIEIQWQSGVLAAELRGEGIANDVPPPGVFSLSIPRTLVADVHDRNIRVPVHLSGLRNIEPSSGQTAVEVEIRYNPSVFYYTGVQPGAGGVVDWVKIIKENNSSVIAVRCLFNNTPEVHAPLFTLIGDALLGNRSSTEFVVESASWGDNAASGVTWEAQSGLLTITGICEEGGERLLDVNGAFGITSITPNPSDGPVRISVAVVEYAKTYLQVYDMYGRLAYEKVWIPELDTQTGNVLSAHSIDVDAELPSGLYFIILSSPARTATAQMVIEK